MRQPEQDVGDDYQGGTVGDSQYQSSFVTSPTTSGSAPVFSSTSSNIHSSSDLASESESILQKRIQYLCSENLTDSVDWSLPLVYTQQRHKEPVEGFTNTVESWRVKDRMKTVSVALVMCLNIGVDPPDAVKPSPCARMECWLDPASLGSQKAVEAIGNALQKQYERWQPRARYKQALDPTVEDVKKLCIGMRKSSKDDRVLLHYTGHGVPKPTANGEIWVFNKNYTQYIPLSVYDLQNWMGVPSVYVYDCSNAGIIVESFQSFANSHQEEYEFHRKNYPDEPREAPPQYKQCIHLAACAAGQDLPTNPQLPADVFTACLTTPIKMALLWYTLQNKTRLLPEITLDMIDKIPGQMNDRRTMLGELNWIFTAVTDTIAWNALPRDLFHKLFRQDLLVASLFRNFLLAERIMRSYKCTPVSFPSIPHSTAQHLMWDAWDFALDSCLCQLPTVLEGGAYKYSDFFTDQLTAFEVWLSYGNEERAAPEQLPIVLQVLLSQSHRVRALDLLGRFVDLGPWAVNQALSVGIFPYILKLLQSSARELRPLLVFIWAKILAVDDTCQSEIVREGGHRYFLDILTDHLLPVHHRSMAAFVLSRTVSDDVGREVALKDNVIPVCLDQLLEPRGCLRQWIAICLGIIWKKHAPARWAGVRESAHEKLFPLLSDPMPEVRAAAVYALGTFLGNDADRSDHANAIDSVIGMQLVNSCAQDGSPLVRREVVVALQWLVLHFEAQFASAARDIEMEDKTRDSGNIKDGLSDKRSPDTAPSMATLRRNMSTTGLAASGLSLRTGNVFQNVWRLLLFYHSDPYPSVSRAAQQVSRPIIIKLKGVAGEIIGRGDPDNSDSSPQSGKFSLNDTLSPPKNSRSPQTNNILSPTDPKKLSDTDVRLPAHSHKFNPKRGMFDPGPDAIAEEPDEETYRRTEPLILSEFVRWCTKTFAQPMVRVRPDGDPLGPEHYEKEFKFIKNRQVRISGTAECTNATNAKYDIPIFMNRNGEIPTNVLFDHFNPLLYVADRQNITTWNYDKNTRVASFSNNHPKANRITDFALLNAQDNPFLLVGSDDGCARIWQNITTSEKKRSDLVSAFTALPDLPVITRSGMVLSWEPLSQHLIAAGDSKVIRVWNVESEMKVVDIPTRSDASVSAVCSQPTCAGLFAAGFTDGTIRMYDRRCSPSESHVIMFDGHSTGVVGAKMPESVLFQKLFSASADGDVKLWDARLPTAVATVKTITGMTAMDVHQKAEICCCGSISQTVNVYNFLGGTLTSIRHYEGFMGQRIGPVHAVAFHPLKPTLAIACTDSFVSVYSGTSDKRPLKQ